MYRPQPQIVCLQHFMASVFLHSFTAAFLYFHAPLCLELNVALQKGLLCIYFPLLMLLSGVCSYNSTSCIFCASNVIETSCNMFGSGHKILLSKIKCYLTTAACKHTHLCVNE